ncbi:MAG: serine hydrolase domain-containing protein [Streptosporangiaceae bacterium]|jgi:CubicO group peptidase (beta-lactamase class C family)
MADLQTALQAVAGELVAAGTETGLQIAVRRDGRLVADVVAGLADPRSGIPVDPGTLFFAASAVKGVAASLAHVLAERGEVRYDLRVAEVWPEFAAHGKEHTTLRHILMHTAGMPGLPPRTTPGDLCDWDRMCASLAAAEPWWEPGTKFGYHALTWSRARCCPGWHASRLAPARRNRSTRGRRPTGPCRPRSATRPRSAGTKASSPPTSCPSAR